jgi:toxin ParE1/3/4
MAKKYTLFSLARADIQEIVHYIANDNPAAARKMKVTILAACEAISQHPLMGQSRDDLTLTPVRFWPVHRSYMIIYNPDINPIQILRIYNSARDVASIVLQ